MAQAASRGMRGVWAVGGDSPGAPPFWRWRQVLSGVSDLVDLRSMADELGLTIDLAQLAPDVFTTPRGNRDGPATTEDRFRQFDAMAALLRQLSRRHPLLIAFDDADMADQPSLLLLRHVARTVKEERLLMVVNHRDSDQTNGPLLAELLREPVTRLIALQGLDPAAVARQLSFVIGNDVGEREVPQFHATTGGNPFFVAKVGRILPERQAGAPAPPSPPTSVR